MATFLGSKTGIYWMKICNTCTFHSSAPNLDCGPPIACWENFIRTHVQYLEQKCEKFYPCKPYFLLYKLWFIMVSFHRLVNIKHIEPAITMFMLVESCNITWKFDPWHSGNNIYRWKWNNCSFLVYVFNCATQPIDQCLWKVSEKDHRTSFLQPQNVGSCYFR